MKKLKQTLKEIAQFNWYFILTWLLMIIIGYFLWSNIINLINQML